ncbi:MAG: heavy metal translocating P-type ATPase, partial [Clostridia bacterium]|nr:heavy metal translocating P-type ATPase [Clostridia bacterium]
MKKETFRNLIRIAAAALLLAAALAADYLLTWPMWGRLLLFLPAYLVAGGDVLREAAEGLLHGEWLDENFLMSVATLGALTVGFLPGGEPSFAEAVLVMLLFQVGEWLE